jgi:uncharacterized protein involved in outer membrane biogenesis
MKRAVRLTLLWTALGAVAVGGALALAYIKLVPTDAQVAERIIAQAEARLGIKVTIDSAQLKLWPRPQLTIEGAQTVQPQPIRIDRLVAQVSLLPLLRGKVDLEHVLVEGGVLPQLSLKALRVRPAPDGPEGNAVQVSQLEFHNVVWITRYETPLEFSGHASFGPDWQLREAELVRPGVVPPAQLVLAPDGDNRWQATVQVGGGSADGHVTLASGPDGALALSGELAPRTIDVESAFAAFKRHSAIHGKASGQTRLSASGSSIGDLARSLHTHTTFSVAAATLLHIDVDKTIRSFGQDRAGQTPLQSLTGQMDTQNTPDGMVVRLTGLQAKGQTFSARGEGTIAKRRVEGELTVDLAGGLVGVPLKVSGPLGQPQVTVPRTAVAGAAAGAAIGTAVLPGIGTAIGAGVGAAVGKLFGGKDAKRPAPAR